MSRKVVVEEYESLPQALRELRILVYEFGVVVGRAWKRRAERLEIYVPTTDRKRQRFYYERPSVKRRRKRLAADRFRRYYQRMSGGFTPKSR